MRLLEHEAKRELSRAGILVPRGVFLRGTAGIEKAFEKVGGPVMIKAQTLDGGRGLRGLIRKASTLPEAIVAAEEIFQSGEDIHGLLVEEIITGDEAYFAIAIDTVAGDLLAIASRFGGVEVETNLSQDRKSERMARYNHKCHLEPWQAIELVLAAKFPEEQIRSAASLMNLMSMYGKAHDTLLVEINPAIFDESGRLVACDAKVEIDDSALWRQPMYSGIRGKRRGTRRATRRSNLGVTYVPLDGDIGVISVGAGVGMAILDTISYFGEQAGNFSDCTGSATAEAIEELATCVFKGDDKSKPPKAVVLYLMLQTMELAVVVQGIKRAIKSRDGDTKIFAVIWAAAAATKSMSVQDATLVLNSLNISMCASLDVAVTSAISALDS